MASDAQIQANRQNALHSTGPRTEAGKTRASHNSRKHGAFAKQLLTPDEQAADLERLECTYFDHYRPTSEFEKLQVQRLVALDWRLRRCGRMEAEILGIHGYENAEPQSSEMPEYEGAGWGFSHDASKSRSLQALSRVEGGISRQYLACKKALDAKLTRPTTKGEPATLADGGSPPADSAQVG